ncbi:unnamed protein product [Owenia fusiformis]|uniref:Spermatogenesis-associated protein 6 N-terminal domain-containing protein n=1 Tax=Owenia fusiformis TaxID=6347 RepID=A0A8S4MYY6_OWEFU|nr:unnamed protein product [Owenia fusiformis]
MPKKGLRCTVEVNVHAVTAPGVWLQRRDDVYISVCLLGQHRRSQLVTPVFPLLIHEKMRFEKVYYTALDPAFVSELLEDEHVMMELIQVSEYGVGRVLATYEENAREFLYPYPTYGPVYGTTDRELLMERTIDFPGISPKVEFSTKTTIKQTKTYYDANNSDLAMTSTDEDFQTGRRSTSPRRSRSRQRSPVYIQVEKEHYEQPTMSSISRSRSPSPSMRRQMAEISLEEDDDNKAPFVVRKLDKSLIGRTPGSPPPGGKKKKKKKATSGTSNSTMSRSRSISPTRGVKVTTREYCPHCLNPHTEKNCTVCALYRRYTGKRYWGHSYHHHPDGHHTHSVVKAMRESTRQPRPILSSTQLDRDYSSDDDVLELRAPDYTLSPRSPRHTRGYSAPIIRPPPRPISPLLFKSSLRNRLGDDPYISPRLSVDARVERALARSRSQERLNRSLTSLYTSPRSPRRNLDYYTSDDIDSIDELAIDLDRNRRY